MAGSGGSRLWPLSRADYPKQFFALSGNRTLFQHVVEWLGALGRAIETIEVQSGSYLGEDDIVRFEDTYGRVL